jgi:hypothetical protein
MKDLFPPELQNAYGHTVRPVVDRQIEATYPYFDETGELVFEVVRYVPKDFRQRRPNPASPGKWIYNLDGVQRTLYRLPEMLSNPRQPVIIVEGEKDADLLAQHGFIATCNPGGTGMGWLDYYSELLEKRRVVIIPDNDEAGMQHAYKVAGSLMVHGVQSLRLLRLPNVEEKGDVYVWFSKGGNRQQLIDLVRECPEWIASPVVQGVA